jgi:uncharacterized protein YndB with AHSA1/START domain
MLSDIVATIDIDASRERVWTALTTAGLVEEWLGCIGFAAEPGHLFYMQPDPAKRAAGDVEGATHCEVEDVEPPGRLRFSWFLPGTPKTHVTISVQERDSGRSFVRLLHDGWDQFDPEQMRGIRDMLAGGWTSFVLPGLKRVAEREE